MENTFIDKCPPLGSYPNKSPLAKARMKKPQGGGKFFMQMPGVRGGMVMDEIDTCRILKSDWLFPLHYLSLFVLASVSLLSET